MDIYREEILEHWQNPLNWGTLRDYDIESEVINPLCGDQIKVQVKLDDKRLTINDIRFMGTVCAISIASASILSENIKGKSLKSLSKISGNKVLELIGGPVTPARLKCAFLALEAIRKLSLGYGKTNK